MSIQESSSVCFNIFYHDVEKLRALVGDQAFSDRFRFVDLNGLALPEGLEISELDEATNKAVFSEYLGILTLEPNTDWVGCFTYSIQAKFSARWALESGSARFMPPIDFLDLDCLSFHKERLYAVEMAPPRQLVREEMEHLIAKFPLKKDPILGPFKGSFVIPKSLFLELQSWLLTVTKYVLNHFRMDEITDVSSPYDNSALSNRSPRERQIDRLRHTYGSILERAVAYFLGAHFEPEHVRLLGDVILKEKVNRSFERTSAEHAQQGDIVISFGNFAYHEVALAWLRKVRGLEIVNYLFISMDEELHELLKTQGFSSFLLPFSGDLKSLWVFRLKTIKRLLDIGLNVIHSDSDAFWLLNPIPLLGKTEGDIVSSQGTIFPQESLSEWGFVLCCGFQYFRSTTALLAFFEELIPLVEEIKDDQKAINLLLLKKKIAWTRAEPSHQRSVNEKPFNCFADPLFGATECGLTVTLLPHMQFQRLLEPSSETPFVLHLLSDKTQEAKLASLREIERRQAESGPDTREVVWLASYPRSGNTLTRTIFKHNFGLNNYSLYNDKADIGKFASMRKFVGHEDGDWEVQHIGEHQQVPKNPAALYETAGAGPVLVKTHSQFHKFYDDFKVIYVVRDPRAVYVSYASYKRKFADSALDTGQLINNLVFDGDGMSGYWNEHVNGWLRNKRDRILVLRFEDILSDYVGTLKKISAFIGVEPITYEPVTFERANRADSNFFRKGRKDSWRDMLPTKLEQKIIASNRREMKRFSYTEELRAADIPMPSGARFGPRFTNWVYICTPTMNCESTIDQTIQTVLSQAGEFSLHYHVQDGGSSDRTLELLANWSELLSSNAFPINCRSVYFTFASDPDAGMYDAIAKGFASMEIPPNGIMSWLNADDVLFPGAIQTVTSIFRQYSQERWLIPSPYTIGESSAHRGRQGNGHPSTQRAIAEGLCDGEHFPFIQQEGLFWSSRLWDDAGGLNTKLALAADWDLWRRFARLADPLFLRYHLGAFRKRKGQLSEDQSAYRSEMEAILKVPCRTPSVSLNEVRRILGFGRSMGYEITTESKRPVALTTKLSANAIEASRQDSRKCAIEKFQLTGLKSYLLEAARLRIKLETSKAIKQQLRDACIKRDFDLIERALKD